MRAVSAAAQWTTPRSIRPTPQHRRRAWQHAGFAWLHVVDLNGAFAGRPVNGAAVTAILRAVTIPVQLGGGIRDMAGIEAWLAAGIRRVILGSAAVKNPPLVREACRAFPGRIVVGIDARDGKVATEGWSETSSSSTPATSRTSFEDAGVAAIIYTDISRDGMLTGLNMRADRGAGERCQRTGDRLGRCRRSAGPARSAPRRDGHANRGGHRRPRPIRRADRSGSGTGARFLTNSSLYPDNPFDVVIRASHIITSHVRDRGLPCPRETLL